MARLSRTCVVLGLLLGVLLGARTSSVSAQSTSTPKNAEPLKLPPGTIVILGDQAGDWLRKFDSALLPAEKYRELLEQLDQLKKQLTQRKPPPPSRCHIVGKVETRGTQSFARLNIEFELEAQTAGQWVFIGCARGKPLSAKYADGRSAVLQASEEGLNARVDSIGPHKLIVELDVPILARGKGDERGFEVHLPGSPITRLMFVAPPKVAGVTLGVRTVDAIPSAVPLVPKPLDVRRYDAQRLHPSQPEPVPLGAAELLDVSWSEPIPQTAPSINTTSSAQAEVVVRVEESEIRTSAKIRLRGAAKEYKLLAPLLADVSIERAAAIADPTRPGPGAELPFELIPTVMRPTDPKKPPIWRILFKEAIASELTIAVQVRIARPRQADASGHGPFPIGPFALIDVFPQPAVIRITAPPSLRLSFPTLRGDTRRRDPLIDDAGDIVFQYASAPVDAKQIPVAPLELEVRPARGAIVAKTTHQLSLIDGGWRLKTALQVTPLRVETGQVDLEVPPELQNLQASPPELVEGISPVRDLGSRGRLMQIRLTSPKRSMFELTIEGFYPLPLTAREATLNLPRLAAVTDRDAQVIALVPSSIELSGVVREWEGERVGPWAYVLEQNVTLARPPGSLAWQARPRQGAARIELAWRTPVVEFSVETTGDITLAERAATVEQKTRVVFSSATARPIRLRAFGPISDLRIADGGRLEAIAPSEWLLHPPRDNLREWVATFRYAFGISRTADDRQQIPLLWPESASYATTRLRFWRDSATSVGWRATLRDGPWRELPIETVPDRDTLPLLVLAGQGVGLPLTILWKESAWTGPGPAVWVDRTLVQALVPENGSQAYRCRFLLRRWQGQSVDVEVPADPSSINLELFADGKRIDAWQSLGDSETGQRLVRVPLPSLQANRHRTLEIRYQLPSYRQRWEVTLAPPRLRQAIHLGSIRWLVSWSPRWVPLFLGEGVMFEDRYTLRQGLPTLVPQRSIAEMERWLAAGSEPPDAPLGWDNSEIALAMRSAMLEPIRLTALSRGPWTIVVSLLAFLLLLLLARVSRGPFWAIGTLLGVTVAWGSLTWPQAAQQTLVAALPGCGLGVLVLAVQSLWRAWQWRRMTYVPGFSRPSGVAVASRGSGSSAKPGKETSTVDAPHSPDSWVVESGS